MRHPRLILISALSVTVLAAVTLTRRPEPVVPVAAAVPAPPVAEPQAPAVPLHPELVAFLENAEAGEIQAALLKVEKLNDKLSATDTEALLKWSVGPRPEKIDEDAWFALVNDSWNALRRQSSLVPGFAPTLAAFFRNPATPYVLRDYSIQHLGGHLEEDFAKLDPAQRTTIFRALQDAAAMRGQGFAGTALYSLQGVKTQSAKDAPTLGENLAQLALALLADPSANNLARISAFQIAIENADPRAAVHARRIAADTTSEPMLRAPAIAYLGRLGTPDDAKLLQSIHNGCSDRRLLGALNPALAKLAATAGAPAR